MNRIGNRAEGIIAYHGTDKTGFAAFEVAAAGPYNIGLHFGTLLNRCLWHNGH